MQISVNRGNSGRAVFLLVLLFIVLLFHLRLELGALCGRTDEVTAGWGWKGKNMRQQGEGRGEG